MTKEALARMIEGSRKERRFLSEQSFGLFCIYYFNSYFKYALAPYHYEFFEDCHDLVDNKIREVAWIAFRESGKRQPLDADILTPTGFKKLYELHVGDFVIGSDGKKTQIEFMSEIVDRPIYELRTEDGRKTECDEEHLWTVRKMSNVANKYETIDIKTILKRGLYYERKPDYRNNKNESRIYKEYKFALDTVKPVQLKERDLPIDPYFLGLWLGDGTSSCSDITGVDKEIENYLMAYANKLGLTLKIVKDKRSNAKKFSITGKRGGNRNANQSLHKKLRMLGVLNNKHIPDDYLYGSIEQRKAVLEGLMDTDGTVGNGTASFSNNSEKIIDGIVSLVRSLGGRATKSKKRSRCFYKGEYRYSDGFRVSVLFSDYTPFRLERKRLKHKLSPHTFSRIISITKKENKLGRCIKVSNTNGLYVTNDYLLTHNTSIAKLFVIWLIALEKRRYINLDSFDKENAERILFDVAFEMTNNNRLRADFGILFSKERGINDIKQNRINNFVTENGIRVEAHSTQESVRGRLHLNQRPDCLILDDIETNKTKDSQAYTKQVADHISEAMAGMSTDGFMLYLGNYITEYGNINNIFVRARSDHGIRVRNVPVVIDGAPAWGAKYVMTDKEAEHSGKVSIEDKQRQLGSQVFSYEMMNLPIDDSIAEFKKEWIQRAEESELEHLNTLTFIAIDTAVSKKDSADYTGVTIDRVSEAGKRYVTTYHMKVNPKELIDHIFYLHDTHNPEVLGVEETVYLLAIQPFLEEEMRKRNKFISITPLKHGGINKETRIRGLIPLFESKSVFLVGDCSALEDEMRVFPRGQHDDCLDSLQYAEQIAFKPYNEQDMDVFEPEKPLYAHIGL